MNTEDFPITSDSPMPDYSSIVKETAQDEHEPIRVENESDHSEETSSSSVEGERWQNEMKLESGTIVAKAGEVEASTFVPNDPPFSCEARDSLSEDEWDMAGIVEAVIFASDEPVGFRQLRDIIAPPEGDEDSAMENEPGGGRRGKKKPAFTVNLVQRLVEALNDRYDQTQRSFRIVEVAHGYAFQTLPTYGVYVGRLYADRSRRRLTQAALETLAIIAFKQPISKPAVEAIRGVNADFVIKSLLERDLITIVGREDSVGRPLLYGTTTTFLKHFGLRSLSDLPKPREIKDLLREEEGPITHSIEEMRDEESDAARLSEEFSSLFDTLHHPQVIPNEEEPVDLGMTGPILDETQDHYTAFRDETPLPADADGSSNASPSPPTEKEST